MENQFRLKTDEFNRLEKLHDHVVNELQEMGLLWETSSVDFFCEYIRGQQETIRMELSILKNLILNQE